MKTFDEIDTEINERWTRIKAAIELARVGSLRERIKSLEDALSEARDMSFWLDDVRDGKV